MRIKQGAYGTIFPLRHINVTNWSTATIFISTLHDYDPASSPLRNSSNEPFHHFWWINISRDAFSNLLFTKFAFFLVCVYKNALFPLSVKIELRSRYPSPTWELPVRIRLIDSYKWESLGFWLLFINTANVLYRSELPLRFIMSHGKILMRWRFSLSQITVAQVKYYCAWPP